MLTSELKDGMKVMARLGRATRTQVEWTGFKPVTLYVARREKTFNRGKEIHPAGEITTMTLKDIDWAEYGEADYDAETDCWLCEDYYLQLKPLV
jgi:hypothetical protein